MHHVGTSKFCSATWFCAHTSPSGTLPPPFEPLRTTKQKDFRSVRIVLIGRFFDGRQGKHHLDAIKTFEKLSSSPSINKTSGDMSLTLVGNLATGQEKYLRKVRTGESGTRSENTCRHQKRKIGLSLEGLKYSVVDHRYGQ